MYVNYVLFERNYSHMRGTTVCGSVTTNLGVFRRELTRRTTEGSILPWPISQDFRSPDQKRREQFRFGNDPRPSPCVPPLRGTETSQTRSSTETTSRRILQLPVVYRVVRSKVKEDLGELNRLVDGTEGPKR